jgi:hypothetical protein
LCRKRSQRLTFSVWRRSAKAASEPST